MSVEGVRGMKEDEELVSSLQFSDTIKCSLSQACMVVLQLLTYL